MSVIFSVYCACKNHTWGCAETCRVVEVKNKINKKDWSCVRWKLMNFCNTRATGCWTIGLRLYWLITDVTNKVEYTCLSHFPCLNCNKMKSLGTSFLLELLASLLVNASTMLFHITLILVSPLLWCLCFLRQLDNAFLLQSFGVQSWMTLCDIHCNWSGTISSFPLNFSDILLLAIIPPLLLVIYHRLLSCMIVLSREHIMIL
jgi:hypothetical protein